VLQQHSILPVVKGTAHVQRVPSGHWCARKAVIESLGACASAGVRQMEHTFVAYHLHLKYVVALDE
jgi:hypothetical protein